MTVYYRNERHENVIQIPYMTMYCCFITECTIGTDIESKLSLQGHTKA